jgi:hypothetical protein
MTFAWNVRSLIPLTQWDYKRVMKILMHVYSYIYAYAVPLKVHTLVFNYYWLERYSANIFVGTFLPLCLNLTNHHHYSLTSLQPKNNFQSFSRDLSQFTHRSVHQTPLVRSLSLLDRQPLAACHKITFILLWDFCSCSVSWMFKSR